MWNRCKTAVSLQTNNLLKQGHAFGVSLLLWCLIVAPLSVHAQDSAKAWYQYISVNGLVSASTTYNFNRPSDDRNQLRIFDVDANSLNLDLLSLTLRHNPAVGEAGFRADIDLGPYIPRLIHSAGMTSGDLDLTQAYLSYNAPIGNGLTFDAGKFICPAGYEYLDRFDGLNDNASHSFLFGYAVPYTMTGLRVTYPFTDIFSACVLVVNGWDNSVDNNRAKTLCLQLSVLPSATSSFILTAIRGAEKPGNNTDMRSVLDLVASLKIGERITLGLNGDYGIEQNDLLQGEIKDSAELRIASYTDAIWQGLAGYARITLSDKFAFILRAEGFDDPQGTRTGTAQSLREYTLTPEWKPAPHLIIRGDLRLDNSTQPVFNKNFGLIAPFFVGGAMVTTQPTASLNALYSF